MKSNGFAKKSNERPEIKYNSPMVGVKGKSGGLRAGAGRKPKEQDLSALAGWALIEYVDSYITGKDYHALAALARLNNGIAVLHKIARFFETAAKEAEDQSKWVAK